MKKAMEFLSGVAVTIISGVFVLTSLVLPMILQTKLPIYLDPAWVAVILSAPPIVYRAVKKLVCNRGISKISSALLISVAIVAACVIGDVFAAGEVAWIMALGEILEDKTTARARKGLQALIEITPTQGRVLRNGTEETMPMEEIVAGDVVRVLPGERIPVDGIVLNGETSVDESTWTGESLPVDKSVGDEVFCGTINRFGAMDVRATRVGENSSFQSLVRLIREAENKKAPLQRIMDKWASWLVPLALLIAVIAGVATQNVVVAVTVLVVFCPCALVLATPTAIMAAIGQATKHGVIIKSGEALERMGKVDVVAFDKTGTLTFGKPSVEAVVAFGDMDERELLSYAASAESKSEHPLGKAVVRYAKECGIHILPTEKFTMDTGKGVSAAVEETRILCGNERYLKEQGVDVETSVQSRLDEWRAQGKAVILVARETKLIGALVVCDSLRPKAKEMIEKLHNLQVTPLLLTGDNAATAAHIAEQAGIGDVQAQLLPQDKVERITALQAEGKQVCMIGDGINDAPALKTADISVAMGTVGSELAIEAADVALIGDDISKIPYLKRLSNATSRTIKFGIMLSLLINFAAIFLSFFGLLTPATGALVHNAGSLLVILIAALLYDRNFDK